MGHEHAHDPKTYYVEQLCTIGICGALGGIAVMLYVTDLLWFIAPKIQTWVLLGGIALLVLVAIRAVVVWVQAGRMRLEMADAHDHHHDHDHDHAHDHDHDHDHAHDHEHCHGHGEACAHDHDHDHDHAHDHGHGHSHGGDDHGHDHGWAPWRYVILLLPVVLYFLGLPNKDMKAANPNDIADLTAEVKDTRVSGTGDFIGEIDFRQLAAAPYTAHSRADYEGKTAVLRGEYVPRNDRMFEVVRYKMNCCSADRVPLPASIVLDRDSKEKIPIGLEGKWVTVQGQIQFQQRGDGSGTFMTVVVLKPDAEHPLIDPEGKNDKALIKVVQRPSNYYLY
jgi:hypothetical protein